ncbi:MAG: hypothetical protein ACK531_02045, partial [Cyanobacteriota bacterium]
FYTTQRDAAVSDGKGFPSGKRGEAGFFEVPLSQPPHYHPTNSLNHLWIDSNARPLAQLSATRRA